MGIVRDSPLQGAADEVEAAVRAQIGVTPRQPEEVAVNRSMRRHLPARCSACGAGVDAEQVRFNEDGSVDCEVCGSIVTG